VTIGTLLIHFKNFIPLLIIFIIPVFTSLVTIKCFHDENEYGIPLAVLLLFATIIVSLLNFWLAAAGLTVGILIGVVKILKK